MIWLTARNIPSFFSETYLAIYLQVRNISLILYYHSFSLLVLACTTLFVFKNWFTDTYSWDENVSIPDHYIRSYLLNHAIRGGSYYPQWFNDLYYGYGYPLLLFTPPAPVYLISLFSLLIDSHLLLSIKVIGALSALCGAIGTYAFVCKYRGRLCGLLSGILYISSPYPFIINIYVRGAIPEVIALALLPWMFFFLVKVISFRNALFMNSYYLILTILLILLTHNISSLISLLLIIFYLGLQSVSSYNIFSRRIQVYDIVHVVFIFLVISFVSMYYVYGVYSNYTNVQLDLASTLFNKSYFLHEESSSGTLPFGFFDWSYSRLLLSTDNANPVGFFAPIFILCGGSCVTLLFSRTSDQPPSRNISLNFMVIVLFLMYLCTSDSLWIYDTFTYLKFIQFPWRLHGPIYFFVAVITGLSAPRISFLPLLRIVNYSFVSKSYLFLLFATLLTIFYNIYFLESRFFTATNPPYGWTGRDLLSASESNRYGAGTTSGGEFLPKSAAWDTETIPSQRRGIRVFDEEFPQDGWTGGMLRALSGMVTFSSLITYDQYIYFQATCSDNAEIAIHQLYFPLWKLEIDSSDQQILMIGDQLERNLTFGIMKVACPDGSHIFKFTFDSGILKYISGSVLIVFLVSPLFRRMRISCNISLAVIILLCIFILVLRSPSRVLGQNRLRSDVFTELSSEKLTTRTPIGVKGGFQPPYLEPRTLSLTYGSALRKDRRLWIYAHPRTIISLPHHVLPSEYLHGAVAMDPNVAAQSVGDGVEFQVKIIRSASNTDIVYNRVVNPRSNEEDLHWHDFWIDLSSYLDSDITIEFLTEYREDSQNDWAGWGVPEIVSWPNARENPGAVHPWYAPSASGIASPPNSWVR